MRFDFSYVVFGILFVSNVFEYVVIIVCGFVIFGCVWCLMGVFWFMIVWYLIVVVFVNRVCVFNCYIGWSKG